MNNHSKPFLKSTKISDTNLNPEQKVRPNYDSGRFKQYPNGRHTHKIEYLPQISKKVETQTSDGILLNTFLNKDRGLSRLSNYIFKKFKPENIEDSISILASPELKRQNSFSSKKGVPTSGRVTKLGTIPEVVNPKANINVKQLELIAKLSAKMNHANSNLEKNQSSSGNSDFKHKYGTLLSGINNGSFGDIKIFIKRIENGKDIRNSQYTFCREGTIFFAIKEFKPKKPDISIETYHTNIISEFIIGNSFFGKCPNIINVFNLMQLHESKFIQVMELCPSGDLYTYVQHYNKRNCHINVLEADCFMKQILNAVSFMHTHGIAHCDIKLENLLLSPRGLLKLCDFGSSSVFQTAWESDIHKQKDNLGTQPYLAPEEYFEKPYDPRLSDCWSCGIVYMTMVLGHYMWLKASSRDDISYFDFQVQMKRFQTFQIFECLTHVNPIRELVRKRALYKIFTVDPNERISAIQLLNTPWIKDINCCQE